jgi:hypothetical protein
MHSLRIADKRAGNGQRYSSDHTRPAGKSGSMNDQHEEEERRRCDCCGEGNLIVHVVNPGLDSSH